MSSTFSLRKSHISLRSQSGEISKFTICHLIGEKRIQILNSCMMQVDVVLDGSAYELVQAGSMNVFPCSRSRQAFARS